MLMKYPKGANSKPDVQISKLAGQLLKVLLKGILSYLKGELSTVIFCNAFIEEACKDKLLKAQPHVSSWR